MKIEDMFTGLYKTFIDNDERIMVTICGRKNTGKSSIAHYLAEEFRKTGVFLRVFASEKAVGEWKKEDLFATQGTDATLSLAGQRLPKKPVPVLNIIDDFDSIDESYNDYSEPEIESFFLITSDVNGLLTFLKNNPSENERSVVVMPAKEFAFFKPLITKRMWVFPVSN